MADLQPGQSEGDPEVSPPVVPLVTAPPPPPPPSPPGYVPPAPPLPAPPVPGVGSPDSSSSGQSTPSLAPADPQKQSGFDPESLTTPFTPLRADPPPKLYSTWWLRYSLFLTLMVAIAVVLLTEYGSGPGNLATDPLVIAPHLMAAVMLVSWSALAMLGAGRLVPSTHYNHRSSGPVAVLLWLVAFIAPAGAFWVVDWARGRFA